MHVLGDISQDTSSPFDPQSLCVSDCPLTVGNMTAIPSGVPLSCHLREHCTAIECCLDLQSPLQRTIHFHLDLDLCLQTLKLGIENLTYEKTLISYSYGLILMCTSCLTDFFSSAVSFSDNNLSVFRHRCCCRQKPFHIFIFFSRTAGPISSKLGTKHPFKFVLMKTLPFSKGR